MMYLTYLRTILQAEEGSSTKVVSITWAPNNNKLAVCTADRVIHLFDESGEKKDKFNTKPIDAKFGKTSYAVKAIAFSPDSTKIAVGQTDKIIYVYKIGETWGEKKVICNKFPQLSAVTTLIWLAEGHIVLGLADGKVRIASTKSNKGRSLYIGNSFVVSLTSNIRGTGFLAGHADGSIVRYYLTKERHAEQQGRIVVHGVPPYALAWPPGFIIAAGCDQRVSIYDTDGRVITKYNFKGEGDKEFTTACCSPSGQTVALGSFNRIRLFGWSPRRRCWREESTMNVKNMYSVTALGWKRDGSRLAAGNYCGAVAIFESVLKRIVWNNKFEMTFVGPSQVLVKPLAPGSRGVSLKSTYGFEIEDVRIMGHDNYIVARTSETVLLGDLQHNLLSEVMWSSTKNEKFYFINASVCLIFNEGELSIVEYGSNEILGSYRTEFMNPHQISIRINERKCYCTCDNKKLAYLIDLKTVCIVDLVSGCLETQVSHDSRIDWLELNETGQKLLIRDKRKRLVLYDISKDYKISILNYCTIVQWVENSDVVVAQSRTNLCVWYNIDSPESVTLIDIKGDIVNVVRASGKSEVIVEEGNRLQRYLLDEELVEFGTAMNDKNFNRAIAFVEKLGDKPEAEGLWTSLGKMAFTMNELTFAQRCYAALGDFPLVVYLEETITMAHFYTVTRDVDGMSCPEVRARLAILQNDLRTAERIYIENNCLDDAIDMYIDLNKWDSAVELAQTRAHPETEDFSDKHMSWLLSTSQYERAAEVREHEADYTSALEFYLQAHLPSRASRMVQSSAMMMLTSTEVVTTVIDALEDDGMLDFAGELYEACEDYRSALDYYRKGQNFSKAMDLARRLFPSEVVEIEEEWGDSLVAKKQLDAAISHYIEAGKLLKALHTAVSARQYKKAYEILMALEDGSSLIEYISAVAQYFITIKEYERAEKIYIRGRMYFDAVEMYNNAGNWERAHKLAMRYLDAGEVTIMYKQQARLLEVAGSLREAEKLYLSISDPDAAITMYKKYDEYDEMLRLVKQFHPKLVPTTHLHLAHEFESDGNYKEAEKHYLKARDWKSAISMYRIAELWEEAYEVAKNYGGQEAEHQVAYSWAKALGGNLAVILLNRLHLLRHAVDFACENGHFEFAFDLAQISDEISMKEIHIKYALFLEDDGKYKDAEVHFILAGKPDEAVLMYVHNDDWDNAQRVAEKHDPASLSDVLIGHGKLFFGKDDYPRFESLLLRARRPDLIIEAYQDKGMWKEAMRICREYHPSRLSALQAVYEQELSAKGIDEISRLMRRAETYETNREFESAVCCLLKIEESNCSDMGILTKAWTKAADLSNRFMDGDELMAVVKILGPRLTNTKQYKLAAQVYLSADLVKDAIDSFILGNEWNRAKRVALELEPRFEQYVDDCYKDSLRRTGETEILADIDINSALDLLVQEGQWLKCFEMAARHSSEVLHKYVAKRAAELIQERSTLAALRLYVKYGAPSIRQNYNIYKRIAIDMFAMEVLREESPYGTWSYIRNILFDVTENMKTSSDAGSKIHEEFDLLLLIAHYHAARTAFEKEDALTEFSFKITVSLLRYTHVIPADKAFLEAGCLARELGRDNEAFVFLNHFLDIHEAIEEGSTVQVDHTDFADITDFPADIPLPAEVYTTREDLESVKEWVIAVSMDTTVDQVLPVDDRMVYEATLAVPKTPASFLPCVVTGYPVVIQRGRTPIEFKRPGKMANRDDWNKLLLTAKRASNPEITDLLNFISMWCGNSPHFSLS